MSETDSFDERIAAMNRLYPGVLQRYAHYVLAHPELSEPFEDLSEIDTYIAGHPEEFSNKDDHDKDDRNLVIHGRFSGFGQPTAWIAADILRIADGVLTEHWDVIQDEASRESSKSGLPMFGEKFGSGK